jgi:hypothetical protein
LKYRARFITSIPRNVSAEALCIWTYIYFEESISKRKNIYCWDINRFILGGGLRKFVTENDGFRIWFLEVRVPGAMAEVIVISS